jgi:hypothetical protein
METTIVLSERELASLIEAALKHRAAEIAEGLGCEVQPKSFSWRLRLIWDQWWMPKWVWHLGFPRNNQFEVRCVFFPVESKEKKVVLTPEQVVEGDRAMDRFVESLPEERFEELTGKWTRLPLGNIPTCSG